MPPGPRRSWPEEWGAFRPSYPGPRFQDAMQPMDAPTAGAITEPGLSQALPGGRRLRQVDADAKAALGECFGSQRSDGPEVPALAPSMETAPGLQPEAPIELTPEHARWIPRWFSREVVISTESATPSWKNSRHGSTVETLLRQDAEASPSVHAGDSGAYRTHSSTAANPGPADISTFSLPPAFPWGAMMDCAAPPAVPLSCSISDLGGSRVGSWRRTLGQPTREAHVASQVPDDTGASSHGGTPELLSACSSASWLRSPDAAEDSRVTVDRDSSHLACADTDDDDLSNGSSGHLDLSSHDSASTASGAGGGSLKRSLSGGSVCSLTTVSSVESFRGDEIAGHVEAPPSGHAWSVRAQPEEQGVESSAASSPSPSRHGGRTPGALSASAASVPASAGDQGIRLSVERAYTAAEGAVTRSILDSGRFRSAYGHLRAVMTSAGSLQTERLAQLLAQEEEAVRSNYGRTRWQSLNMEHDVDPGWDARKRSARNSQLQWIKDEQVRLSLLAVRGKGAVAARPARSRSRSLSLLSSWTLNNLVPKKREARRLPGVQWRP